MKISYKNSMISMIDGVINSASTIIDLYTETNAVFFGLFELGKSGLIKTVQFEKMQDGLYKARLVIRAEEIRELAGTTFRLKVQDATFSHDTNSITPIFDQKKIALDAKSIMTQEHLELASRIKTLEESIKKMRTNKRLEIVSQNSSNYIQEGMVPVAMADGTFIAAFPFNNYLREINGLKAVDGVINVTPAEILYKNISLMEYLENVTGAIEAINKRIDAQQEVISGLNSKLTELAIEFEAYKNKGLI